MFMSISFLLDNEEFNIYFFSHSRLPHFFFSNHLTYFFTSLKNVFFKKNKSPGLSSIHWTRFFFKIIQHRETWNVIGLFLSCKLEEKELVLFFKSCIIQIFVHQVCMNSLFYTVKLVESYKFHHTNGLL